MDNITYSVETPQGNLEIISIIEPKGQPLPLAYAYCTDGSIWEVTTSIAPKLLQNDNEVVSKLIH